MEITKNKNAVFIIENPTKERMDQVKTNIEKTQYVDNVRYAENRVIIEDVSDEDFKTINEYFDKVNKGLKPTPGEDEDAN